MLANDIFMKILVKTRMTIAIKSRINVFQIAKIGYRVDIQNIVNRHKKT